MTSRYLLGAAAEADLDEIIQYLTERSADAPRRVFNAFEEAFDLVSRNPEVGHKRDDLTDRPLKFLSVFSYLIAYNPATSPVQIVAVLHGARDVQSLLGSREHVDSINYDDES